MDKTHKRIVTISKPVAETIEKYISNEVHLDEDETIIYTAKFPGGIEMDIKCCGVQNEEDGAWTEAVLFKNGCEVAVSGVEEEFLGEWSLKFDGVVYNTIIEIEKGSAIISSDESQEEHCAPSGSMKKYREKKE